MAEIEVNYLEIPGKATQMQNAGRQLNSELTSAWTSVNELRGTWHGVRYNSLISYFNGITNQVNEILKLVVCDIPDSLGTIAKNYAAADGQTVAYVDPGSVTAIETIADTDTSTFSYDAGAATDVQAKVNGNISAAEGYMNEVETIFNTISWESEAKESYKGRLSSLKSQIVDALENINTQFTRLMEEAQTDIINSENANNIG